MEQGKTKKDMKYEQIKMVGDTDSVRYALYKRGYHHLVVIGVNPSTANEDKPDPTMNKVMGFAEYNDFDSFMMFNLYPQRTTDPKGLDKEIDYKKHRENIRVFTSLLPKYPTILLAFGNLITIRPYLAWCLKEIVEAAKDFHPVYRAIAVSKNGNPVHPLYQRYKKLEPFNIKEYLKKI